MIIIIIMIMITGKITLFLKTVVSIKKFSSQSDNDNRSGILKISMIFQWFFNDY